MHLGIPAPRTTIAVIDDDVRLAGLVKMVLEETSDAYRVEIEPRVNEGFAFIKGLRPNVVILDMMMGVDAVGFETLDRLSEDVALCEIPVVISSAGLFPAERYRAFKSPLLQLPKPFRLEELLQAVESALSGTPSAA